jgi:hypothetical protein
VGSVRFCYVAMCQENGSLELLLKNKKQRLNYELLPGTFNRSHLVRKFHRREAAKSE